MLRNASDPESLAKNPLLEPKHDETSGKRNATNAHELLAKKFSTRQIGAVLFQVIESTL